MTITRVCPMCGNINTIEVPDSVRQMVVRYQNGVGYIQDIPLPPSQREFIKTGYCMGCQKILFAPPEEEGKIVL